jgi:7-cyano-7-deazaguanine synthase
MINIAACLAEARRYDRVIIGANREEGRFFPDNTSAFVRAVNRSLFYSTRGKVRVMSFTERLTKRQILRRGLKLKAPLYYLWSCYEGGRELCLRCHSCGYLVEALNAEGVWESFWRERKERGV